MYSVQKLSFRFSWFVVSLICGFFCLGAAQAETRTCQAYFEVRAVGINNERLNIPFGEFSASGTHRRRASKARKRARAKAKKCMKEAYQLVAESLWPYTQFPRTLPEECSEEKNITNFPTESNSSEFATVVFSPGTVHNKLCANFENIADVAPQITLYGITTGNANCQSQTRFETYTYTGCAIENKRRRPTIRVTWPEGIWPEDPWVRDERVDWCATRNANCGEVAAQSYCTIEAIKHQYVDDRFARRRWALDWEKDENIGASLRPTVTPVYNEFCRDSSCDGFEQITCSPNAKRFDEPILNYRVDWCLNYGSDCGKPAADEFCKRTGLGFNAAIAYEKAENVGVDNIVTQELGPSKRVCRDSTCDGFKRIVCWRKWEKWQR